MEITVTPKNPPSGANGWIFKVQSHDEANSTSCFYHTIDEPITQQVPAGWFPLYSSIAFFSAPRAAPILEILNYPSLSWYGVAYDASLPLITDYGSYYFNVATRQFEEIVAPVYEGTITRMELEYDGARASIPAYNIPQGERGLIHIWGRNDMATSEKLGVSWVAFDPDGIVVEEYENWESGTTSPGSEHEFIGGRFPLDKEGIYIISVGLKMSPPPAYPTLVDTYYGDLCTVGPAVPEYKGSISKKELEYDETRGNIPVY